MTLSIFQDTALDIPLAEIFGKSMAILGIKGSGKSNTAARIFEQLLKAGVPVFIVDIAGEYWGLKERFALVVAGKSANVDLELTSAHQAAALAVWSLEQSVSVILDLSDYDDEMRLEILKAYLYALWTRAGLLRRPYFILLEEAHNWIPQSGNTPVKPILVRIATEGRKRGLGIIMVGQRSARLDKNVLTQADYLILHRVRHPSDVSVYQDIIPHDKKVIKAKTVNLATGEALLVTDTVQMAVVQVLPRETYHAGYTPGIDDVQPPTLTGLAGDTLASLRLLLAQPGDAPVESRTQHLENTILEQAKQIAEQLICIADLEGCVQKLTEENTFLSKLKVEFETTQLNQMHVDTLTAGRVNGSMAIMEAPAPASDVQMPLPLVPKIMPEGNYRSDRATVRAINRQRSNFDSLIRDVKAQSVLHRRCLAYLINRTADEFDVVQLARYLGVQPKTLTDRPPLWMVQKGLIQRERRGRTFYYTAADSFNSLAALYPDLNSDEIWDILVSSVDENRG